MLPACAEFRKNRRPRTAAAGKLFSLLQAQRRHSTWIEADVFDKLQLLRNSFGSCINWILEIMIYFCCVK